MKKKTHLGPKRRHLASFGPFLSLWACVGLCWPSLAAVGLCGAALAGGLYTVTVYTALRYPYIRCRIPSRRGLWKYFYGTVYGTVSYRFQPSITAVIDRNTAVKIQILILYS